MARGLTSAFGPIVAALLAGAAHAQTLADPTRPPADLVSSSPGMPAAGAPSGLQSIILRKEGRPAALINGTVVELGGMVGDARLVKIEEDAVVLLGPGGRETLQLMPGLEKVQKTGAGGTAKPIGLNAYKSGKQEEKRR